MKYLFHSILVLGLIALAVYVPYPPPTTVTISTERLYRAVLLDHVVAAVAYFLNYYVFIPFLFYRRRTVYYCALLGYVLLGLYLSPFHFPLPQLMLVLIAFMLSYIAHKAEEKALFEITLLKQQMQPHFFFNTLNGIYGLAIQQSDKTPESILQLANMMRYVLYESAADRVPLEKELDHVRNYFQMQQLRLGSNNKINITIDVDEPLLQIAPFILIPFIENNFKHGISADKKTYMEVDISYSHDTLHFYSSNTIVKNTVPGGVGIKNVKRRLELIYSGKYTLQFKQEDQQYIVQLSMQL